MNKILNDATDVETILDIHYLQNAFSVGPRHSTRRGRNRRRIEQQQKQQRFRRKVTKAALETKRLLRTGDYNPRHEGDARERETSKLRTAEIQFDQMLAKKRPAKPKDKPRAVTEAARKGETNERRYLPETQEPGEGMKSIGIAVNARAGRRIPLPPPTPEPERIPHCKHQRALLGKETK